MKICKDSMPGLQSVDSSVLFGRAFLFSSFRFSFVFRFLCFQIIIDFCVKFWIVNLGIELHSCEWINSCFKIALNLLSLFYWILDVDLLGNLINLMLVLDIWWRSEGKTRYWKTKIRLKCVGSWERLTI